MSEKILFVDDEQRILDGFKLLLRKRYDVTVALGAKEGLDTLTTSGPFAVLVSDLKMPKMDGITFLSKVRENTPETVRIMLTGFASVRTATEAVNKGQIFRFLTKPCPTDDLILALDAGLEQHRLVTAERELLHGTLRGCIRVLSEALGLANPNAFSMSLRVKGLVSRLLKNITVKSPLEIELACMLSHIGCMGLPRSIIEKMEQNALLTPAERANYDEHPRIGASLIRHIPRFSNIANIIAKQRADLSPDQPLGARILRLVQDYDMLESSGLSASEIFEQLRSCLGCYDLFLIDAMEETIVLGTGFERLQLRVGEFLTGMILREPVKTKNDLLLMAKGGELNEANILRLNELAKTFEIVEPIAVLAPLRDVAFSKQSNANKRGGWL